jgi:hypothetical protein
VAKKENEIDLQDLLGRRVRDAEGHVVGRLEEFRAEREGDHWVVTRYHIGPAALLERLAVRHFGITWGQRPHGYEAQWDQMDVSNPERPTLTCTREELRAIRGR